MKFWVFLFFLGVIGQASAQQYFFRNYSLKEGLPQSEIFHIVNGPKGGLWTGTNGGGIARFNGKRFEIFNNKKHGILHDQIIRLFFDKKGTLWIGTVKGVSRYDGHKVKNFPLPEDAASEFVYWFFEDDKKPGRVWAAATLNNDIRYFEGDKEVDFIAQYPQLKGANIIRLLKVNNGNFLIVTNRGLFEYNGAQLKKSTMAQVPEFKGKVLLPFLYDNRGITWLWVNSIGGPNGKLFKYKKGLVEEISLPKEYASFAFTLVGYKDSRNNLWLPTTNGNGIVKYNRQQFQNFNQSNGLPTTAISSVVEDDEGNIWIGSRGSGLIQYTGDKFILYDKATNGFSSNFVRAIYQDRVGNYWFGTQDKGIIKFDGKETTNYFNDQGSQIGRVHDFLRIDDQQFLVSTEGKGLLKFDGKKFTSANQAYHLPPNRPVLSSYRDGDTFWFGVGGLGLIRYSPKGIDTLTSQKDGLVNNIITGIAQDKNKNMWFSSLTNRTGGLSMYDGKKLTTWKRGSEIKTDLVMQVVGDDAGGVWIGTYGAGLIRFFQGKFHYYSTDNGITTDNVYSLIKDDQGNIWMGAQDGIDKITLDKQGKVVSFKHYSSEEGFMGMENNGKAIYKDLKGNLWFGTINGAMKYNANARRLHHKNTKLNLTGVKLFLRPVDWRSEKYNTYFESIDPFFSIPKQLKLPYHLNHISLHFEGVSYFLPENVRFQWRLKGLEKDWSPVSVTDQVVYTNLSPGKYTFQLKASNSWNQWTNSPYTFEFEVMKPIWQTWWFRILVTAVIVLLVILSFRWRLSAIKARKKELERLVDEKTTEIRSRNEEILEKNTELEQQKGEILIQNEQIHLQNEEIQVQRDQLEMAFQNVQLLSEIGQKVTANLSIQKIADTLHEQIAKVMPVDEFSIGLYNAEKRALIFNLIYVDSEQLPSMVIPITQKKRLPVHSFLNKKSLFSGDVKNDYASFINDEGVYNSFDLFSSLICVPVLEGEEGIGIIFVQSRQMNAYEDHHLSMLRSLSTYVAIAAKNSQVFNQVKRQKQEIEIKNENITASINYAKQIQQAILGNPKEIARYFKDTFVMLQPRDIVSGDFYWCSSVKPRLNRGINTSEEADKRLADNWQKKVVLVAADCTGHGVPGAFMTLLGSSFLDDIICKEKVTQPDLILEALEEKVMERLQKDAEDRMNDGMDMAVISFDNHTLTLQYAGAKSPLWVISNGQLREYKGSKYPIGGGSQYMSSKVFDLHTIQLHPRDVFYLFSDGFQDQFGGIEGKKFMRSRLRNLLLDIHSKPMERQKSILEEALKTWMSHLPKNSELKQVDDILVIGVSV